MDKQRCEASSWWQAHRPTTRRLVQLYAALLHNAYLRGFIEGKIYEGKAKYLCVPGLNCYSCPGAAGACPLGSLQNALACTGHRAGWYVLGMLLLFGVVLGRTICGWLCPLGLIQELLHRIPTPKLRKSRFTRMLSLLKYAILAVFVTAVPLWYGLTKDLPLPAFCKYICPAGTLEGAAGHLANPANASMYSMLGILFTRKWIIMLTIALACVFCYRSFCRFICPLGAIYSLFSRFTVIGVRTDADRCNGCGACVRHCPVDVKRVGDRECIHCGKCMDVCTRGAISLKAGRITLRAPETGNEAGCRNGTEQQKRSWRVFRGIALAVLCLVLLWFNFLDPSIRKNEPEAGTFETVNTGTAWESDAPVGHETGNQLADFTLTCYDGTQFHLADTRGRVVFINRWATWCTPCREELPYFNDLYREHGEDIAMIAVHPSMIVDDPEAAAAGYDLPFATDTEDDAVRTIVGGTGTLPQTVVLNRRGEVIYNAEGSVTPELLEALYTKAAEQDAVQDGSGQ